MTEAEWLESTDSLKMFEVFRGTRLDSRLRRFAVECCRRVRHLIVEDAFRVAADAGEAFADDPHNEKDTIRGMSAAVTQGWQTMHKYKAKAAPNYCHAARAALGTCGSYDWVAAYNAMREAAQAVHPSSDSCDSLELEYQAAVLRCIFGPLPFRPVTIDPSWLTWHFGTIPKLAQAIYDERRFEDMPILADALEEAGCTDSDILGHCRSKEPHCRGCWVVDLILGKE